MGKSISKIVMVSAFTCVLAFSSAYGFGQAHEAEAQHGEEHAHHNHHLGLFAGGTTNLKKDETDFTLGIEYEYLLDKKAGRWKIGVVGELIFAHETEYLLALPVIFQITDSFYFRAGPGLEWSQHGQEEEHSMVQGEEANGHSETKTEFFVRIGIGYALKAGTFTITPMIDLDIFEGHTALVWGVAIGKGF